MPKGLSHFERRSHFALRILLLMLFLVLPALVIVATNRHVLTIATAEALMDPLVVLAFGAILLAGPVLFRDLSIGSGFSGGEGGGGPGPSQPPSSPSPPRGGIPLPDADQARVRVRDHDRPERRGVRPRRPAREPGRAPVPTLPNH